MDAAYFVNRATLPPSSVIVEDESQCYGGSGGRSMSNEDESKRSSIQ